jgi:hypothetical protein
MVDRVHDKWDMGGAASGHEVGIPFLYRWRTSPITVDVGSMINKDEKAQKKHMADISASCSEPRVIDRLAVVATKQLLNMLKQSTTISELEPGSARIVLRNLRVNKLIVLSNDVCSIHEMQRKSNLVAWWSNACSGMGDVLNNQRRALKAEATNDRNIARPSRKASVANAASSTRGYMRIAMEFRILYPGVPR